ncbi:acyl carrier protein [Streptomyces sp. NPDC093225]|uniref:acyl carrier protein n=1 Tax=Streptomyces sp. NPDC093225 TaxID=3366034 RepID=UPI003815C593
MRRITIGELDTIMRACAVGAEGTPGIEQAPDRPFGDLGYDSLALLETCSRIERDFDVVFSEDGLGGITTARELVELVNWLLQLKEERAA